MMNLKKVDCVEESSSEACPVANFSSSDVKPSKSTTTDFVI
jgi:hypothetical protein